jgi:hypothetical protein
MIGQKFNFEDVFFRDLTVCVLDTLEGQLKWVNKFSSGDVFVNVPFYYSLSGDERFLLDTFQDDIVSENRYVELNTDIIPRGHITMKSFNIMSDEFANPNVWLRMVVENQVEIRKVLAKVRAVPITVEYELTILLSNEIDTFKCSQAIMDTLWIYKFMYFEHNFMNIDAVILMPDTSSIEINREKNLTSDNTIKMTVNFQVQTYYPAIRRDRINLDGYPIYYGGGQVDSNGYVISGSWSIGDPGDPTADPPPGPYWWPKPFPKDIGPSWPDWPLYPDFNSFPRDPIPGRTGSFGNLPNAKGPGGFPDGSNGQSGGGQDSDYFIYSPKRTRWFSNILKARESARASNNNPNSSDPNPNNNGSV